MVDWRLKDNKEMQKIGAKVFQVGKQPAQSTRWKETGLCEGMRETSWLQGTHDGAEGSLVRGD